MIRPKGNIIPKSKVENFSPQPINKKEERINAKIQLVLDLIKTKDRTIYDLVVETGYSARTVAYYLKIIKMKKMIKIDECPHCRRGNMFYRYVGK